MEVVAEAAAGAADQSDHVALRDRARGDQELRLVGVTAREPAAVVDAGVVAVAAARGLGLDQDDVAVLDGADRGARRRRDVDAGVEAAPARTERRGDRAVDRPDEAAARALDRAGGKRIGGRSSSSVRPGAAPGSARSGAEMSPSSAPSRAPASRRAPPPCRSRTAASCGLARLELDAGPLELRLLGRDLVARRRGSRATRSSVSSRRSRTRSTMPASWSWMRSR